MRRPRLVYVVTHPVTADLLLRGQLTFMRERGFDVTVVAAPGKELDRLRTREGVETIAVPMARPMELRSDAIALGQLTSVLRKIAPDIVNAGTTKAGLLGMMAARAANVPIRIYLLRGLRLETARGAMRKVLALTEKIACACAHDVACVSPSLLRLSVDGGFIPRKKALVVGAGSSNGVDTDRFVRSAALHAEGTRRMAELGIASDDKVIAFIGRLAWDKGIVELLQAFTEVKKTIPNVKLALLGGDLGGEKADSELAKRVAATPGVVSTGTIADLAPYYGRMDLLAFPSYREGFPNVPLEAASAEVPVVGFRSTGVVDAVADGATGELVKKGDIAALTDAIVRYLNDPARAAAHGRAARERALAVYSRNKVWSAWLDLYTDRLRSRDLPLPS